jgi:hypothetical protein
MLLESFLLIESRGKTSADEIFGNDADIHPLITHRNVYACLAGGVGEVTVGRFHVGLRLLGGGLGLGDLLLGGLSFALGLLRLGLGGLRLAGLPLGVLYGLLCICYGVIGIYHLVVSCLFTRPNLHVLGGLAK